MSGIGKVLPFRRPKGPAVELSDEALLAACATGDTAALGELFERFHEAVYRFLSRFVGATSSELEDLLQMTFMEVLRAAAHFRGASTVRAFIFGIAANVAHRHCRSESRRLRMYEGSARQPIAAVSSPAQGAESKEVLRLLARAIEQLPHDQRVAFVMCDVEEIPGVEVARMLDIPPGTLWRRLHDARRTLRRALGENPP